MQKFMLVVLAAGMFCFTGFSELSAETREEKVQNDRQKVLQEGFWIYNDLQKGFAASKQTGKPLLVVLRCIPCVACVKLDDEMVDRDPAIRPLLEKYVCVRIVSTNGLDLNLFQFDTDQSFAVFMLNSEGDVYGRFGTRSHRTDWYEDVSLAGMAKALAGGLELHADWKRGERSKFTGKKGSAWEFASPEKYPSLKDKYAASIDFSNNVVKSCIHCHQIGDARREFFREQRKPIPEELFFPFPHPKSIGLIFDPEEMATVKMVEAKSPASQSGLKAGDEIQTINGQRILSLADVQWCLNAIPATGGLVEISITRQGQPASLSLQLDSGWRRAGDLSWRVSSWGMRRMFLGGLRLVTEEAASGKSTRLVVEHVGQYNEHAVAKRAGFNKGDVIVSWDGKTEFSSEADLFWYCNQYCRVGQKVPVVVERNGRQVRLELLQQK